MPVCEWPTLALLIFVFGGWAGLLYFANALGYWLCFPFLALLITLSSSLQHEVLHGHPTRSKMFNEALVYLPLGLFIPYRRFKQLHLRHHNNDRLTDPYDDPESFYWAWSDWTKLPGVLKAILTLNNTLLGRLIIGPAVSLVGFYGSEMRAMVLGDKEVRNAWLHHLIGAVPVVLFVSLIGNVPFWLYVLTVCYPAMSLLMLRTFAEHRAHKNPDARSIIVEFCPLFSVLFLNNNLHVVHHAYPRIAWYRLPDLYQSRKAEWQSRNDGYVYKSYFSLARQYLLSQKEPVAHPLMKQAKGEGAR
ncbi:fatty acid desaturase [Roseibium hamelinense]|nr:fatty acid desaturase [Roseibium hamelinense]